MVTGVRQSSACVVLVTLGVLVCPVARGQEAGGAEFFERSVRPLLAQHCYACHSKASNPVMGGLRLDTREGLQQGGSRGLVVQAGDPAASLLIRAVRYEDKQLRMPPTGKLRDAEIATLAAWIEMGAPWGSAPPDADTAAKPFWAFQPPTEPALPAVENAGWVRSPLDRFILAALEAKELQPAPPADQRTMIRRATFDLTGLPPTLEEVQAFLQDDSPDAFARVVDRLLRSPRYGERWGRHWLDVARYADSNGLDENLVYKNAFRYRDYVIQSFNEDKPYDQFILEQLAGDLLPAADTLLTQFERWTATGFLALGAKMLAEDDPVKMQMDIIDEQLDTTMRAFMGLTVGCARCHDHKFDPISIEDYYALAGILKSSKTMEHFKVVAMWHEYVLAPKTDRDRLREHEQKIEAKNKEINRITKANNGKLAAQGRRNVGSYLLAATDLLECAKIKLQPVMPEDEASIPAGAVARSAASFDRGNVNRNFEKSRKNIPDEVEDAAEEGGSYFAEYDLELARPGAYQIQFFDAEMGYGTADLYINGVLMKTGAEPIRNRVASPDAGGWSVTGIFPFTTGKNTLRLEHKDRFPYFERLLIAPNPLPDDVPVPKTLDQIAREYKINPGFLEQWVERLRRTKGAPHSVLYAWHALGTGTSWDEWASPVARLFQDFRPSTRQALAERYEQLFQQADQAWQTLYGRSQESQQEEDPESASENSKEDKRKLSDPALEALRQVLYEKFGPFRPPADSKQYFTEEVRTQLAELEEERRKLEESTPDFPRAMGVTEGDQIGDLPIHIRGSHWNLGDPVPRGFLKVISGHEQIPLSGTQSGRLELAQWIAGKDNPLTSRVMVNRVWRWHFGRGIVPSTDNFGKLGERPTNQALLDWLALRFVESGWSVKQMHRLILLSSAYQMSASYDANAAKVDPENMLLWRMNRKRLEAEAIRDAVMAVAGGLDYAMGGSILHYKDRQYVSNTKRSGDIDYDRNIRAVYLPVVRSSMYDFFQAFDLADPSVSNGNRNSTTVAPQALFMMNGSVVLEHSRKWAAKLLTREDLDDSGRIRVAYERALARLPSQSEIDRALTFIHRMESSWNDSVEGQKSRLRAWQGFCQALMASNEFIYVN